MAYRWGLLAGFCLSAEIGTCWSTAAGAAPPPVSDAQVVASMRRGIDFLLSKKNGDNWEEGDKQKFPGEGEVGGQTAIALYALLHAGESLQDDPDYHARLHWRSGEMAPAVAWLSKFNPVETYVA